MSRSLKLFFIGSVLLNLMLLGMVCGHVGRSLLPPTDRPTVEQIVATLPADKRALFQQRLDAIQKDMAPIRAEIDAARQESLCILATDPFDENDYEFAMEHLHHLHKQLTKHIVAAAVDVASQFEPQARIAFMDLLRPTLPPRLPENPCAHVPVNPNPPH